MIEIICLLIKIKKSQLTVFLFFFIIWEQYTGVRLGYVGRALYQNWENRLQKNVETKRSLKMYCWGHAKSSACFSIFIKIRAGLMSGYNINTIHMIILGELYNL